MSKFFLLQLDCQGDPRQTTAIVMEDYTYISDYTGH